MASHSMGLAQVEFSFPSGPVLLAIAPLVLLYLGLVAFSLVDLIRAPSVRYLPKAVWALIIVLVGTGLGAIGYLVFGRARGPVVGAIHDRTGDHERGHGQPPDSFDSAQVGDAASLSLPTATRTFTTRTDAAAVETSGLTRDYGGGGLFDVDLSVPRGSIYGLVGPNGAGKTTMLDIITGKTRPDQGRVVWDEDTDLTRLDEADTARLGIGRKFQKPTVFETLSVESNMMLALAAPRAVGATLFHRLSGREAKRIGELLDLVRLADVRQRLAGSLSHGQKQWLEIGMLLAQEPQLLLVDEPAAGMTDAETMRTAELLRSIAGERSVVVIEHDMEFVNALDCKVTVLHRGTVLAEGSLEHVSANPEVIEVYLGR
jgi:urea transport system ATP-binding protein